ncbi:hypothetical protein [Bacillus niameyensis]|uniref:hypothetical protein n=1 Tax=Bacillus niameyensis TaxID=1522308 RepID=UPI0007838220|nr:hypothetical protein [Bacillus niameyensis]
MNSKYRVWGLGNFIKDHLLLFVLLTIILTKVSNKGVDNWLSHIANADNQTLYTYHYSLGINGLILVIPSAIVSILLIKGALKLEERYLPSPILIRFNAFGIWCFKTLLKVGKMVIKVSGALIYGFFWIIHAITAMFEIGKGGSSYSGHSVRHNSNNSYDKDRLKKEADWEARQKEKEANYALKQAIKQGNYNKNTYHFDYRVNRTKAMIHEANKAKKRARDLR